MRKLILVMLGLLLLGGAVGAATYRYVLSPEIQMRAKDARGFDSSYRTGPGPSTHRQPQLSALQIFDIVVNVLNVVVGVIGIYLTLTGLRLQRRAAAGRQIRLSPSFRGRGSG